MTFWGPWKARWLLVHGSRLGWPGDCCWACFVACCGNPARGSVASSWGPGRPISGVPAGGHCACAMHPPPASGVSHQHDGTLWLRRQGASSGRGSDLWTSQCSQQGQTTGVIFTEDGIPGYLNHAWKSMVIGIFPISTSWCVSGTCNKIEIFTKSVLNWSKQTLFDNLIEESLQNLV